MWIFKGDDGKYLHAFKVGLYGRIEDVKWTEFQMLAHRFSNRNAASIVAESVGAAGSIKTLIPKGLHARLDKIEKSQRDTKATQLDTLAQIAAVVRGATAVGVPLPSEGDPR